MPALAGEWKIKHHDTASTEVQVRIEGECGEAKLSKMETKVGKKHLWLHFLCGTM